ncbi:MFS transporter [Paenarthrobacter nitroguajacolicus]|uniref:MFS transporter n=1 Tax=Paenarthrobacter nitroguajacolicus TaxID=211146 RepID=UPI0040544D1F
MANAIQPAAPARPQHRRAAFAAFSGQAIEYYDFYLYGTAAALVIGPLFFPSDSAVAGTLAAFATFAAGFLLRPIGAIVFGHLGDKLGRKKVLVTTLFLMGGATTLIGALPTYDAIGVWAPILLVFLRCLQGFALGGEWGGASLVAVEHSPKGKEAFFGSMPQLGSPAGLMLSTAMVLLFGLMPSEAFLAWGWRIPFLLSALLLLIGLMIRAKLDETPDFKKVQTENAQVKFPIVELFKTCKGPLLAGLAAAMLTSGGYFLVNTFTVSYATEELGLDKSMGLTGQLVTSAVQAVFIVVIGTWAIRKPPRLIAAGGALLVAAWAFPLYGLMNTSVPAAIWFGQAVATIFQTGLWAVLPALLAAQFPARLRYTGISLCYQGASLLGGFTPFVATYLLDQTGSSWSIATLLLVLGVISGIGCIACRRAVATKEATSLDAIAPSV